MSRGRPRATGVQPAATGFDSGPAGPSWMQENFLIQSQQLKDRTGSTEDNHSLTETFVRDAAGNAFEFGVSSDAQNATTKPTLFTTAWTAGNFLRTRSAVRAGA